MEKQKIMFLISCKALAGLGKPLEEVGGHLGLWALAFAKFWGYFVYLFQIFCTFR